MGTDGVAHFLADTPIECSCFSIKAKVVSVQRDVLRQRSDSVYAPKSNCMVGRIVENPRLVQVRPHCEAVNLPRTHTGLHLEPVKAQADVGALPNVNQAPGAIFKLVSPGSELDPVVFVPSSDFEKSCLEIEFFFVDRSWAADTVRIQAALELHKRANVLAVVNVKIEHVPFVEIAIHEGLLAPVVISDLFPNLAGFAADGEEPGSSTWSQTDVFDSVPKFLTLGRIGKKAPVFVFPQ